MSSSIMASWFSRSDRGSGWSEQQGVVERVGNEMMRRTGTPQRSSSGWGSSAAYHFAAVAIVQATPGEFGYFTVGEFCQGKIIKFLANLWQIFSFASICLICALHHFSFLVNPDCQCQNSCCRPIFKLNISKDYMSHRQSPTSRHVHLLRTYTS